MSLNARIFIFACLVLALKYRPERADKNSVPMSSHFETWHAVCTGKIHADLNLRFSI